jgi:hypothetical protein
MMTRTRAIIVATIAATACGGGSPTTPSEGETITGSERFGWDQPAADAGELATFRYALYVDNARSEAADVSCATGPSSGRFVCTSLLPAMGAGAHTLQVAAFVIDGGVVRESPRSASVRVVKR